MFNPKDRNCETESRWRGYSYSENKLFRIVHLRSYKSGKMPREHFYAECWCECEFDGWFRLGKFWSFAEACRCCSTYSMKRMGVEK